MSNNSEEIYENIIDSVNMYIDPNEGHPTLNQLSMRYDKTNYNKNLNNNLEILESKEHIYEHEIATLKAIDANLQESIMNQLIQNEVDPAYKEVKEFHEKMSEQITKFKDYANNHRGEIMEKYSLDEGYNSITGNSENSDTLLKQYIYNGSSQIQSEMYYNLSDEAKQILKQVAEINNLKERNTAYALMVNQMPEFDDKYNKYEDFLNNIDVVKKDIERLGEAKYNLINIDYRVPKDDIRDIEIFNQTKNNNYKVIEYSNFNTDTVTETNVGNPLKQIVNDKNDLEKDNINLSNNKSKPTENDHMNQLRNEFYKLKDYTISSEKEDKIYNKKNEIRNEFINEMINLKSDYTKIDTEGILEHLSDNQKVELYNYVKDINSYYKNLSIDHTIEKEYENNLVIKELEQNIPNIKDYREEHLTNSLNNSDYEIETMELKVPNNKLGVFLMERNVDIQNMSFEDKAYSSKNQENELKILKQNSKSNQIKNNDMFKKMSRLEVEEISNNKNEKKTNTLIR
ncbi:hypothetical protein O0H59_12420 [Staphylococcus pseudintermedius]|nr:hypothetical protein [Staphylococcus pseudintermedius]